MSKIWNTYGNLKDRAEPRMWMMEVLKEGTKGGEAMKKKKKRFSSSLNKGLIFN